MDWEGFFRDYRKPDFIPGYTILNKLGGGVFGDVYKAKKTSIGKFYAIKFLKVQDERLSEQVMRELESVDHFAQVDHPNLVSIEDRGEVGGIPFIVMGYAGDETLKTILRGGALEATRANTVFRQLVQGVKALHEHSIVHFDLKPANIFIKGDVARVGDYGLSKLMSESRGTLSMGRGTPYYMAPEMLRRKGDARSDVYSLGVIYFEMMTGDVPFKGDSEWEILKKHETDPVSIPPSISAAVASFLRQSLDKNPERRFRNAGAQLAALDAVTSPQVVTVQATTPTRPYQRAATGAMGGPSTGRHATQRTHRMVGETASRLAYRGHVSIDRGRQLLTEILQQLRSGSKEAVDGAKRGWQAARGNGALAAEGLRAKRALDASPAGAGVHVGKARRSGAVTLAIAPLRLLRWVFRMLGKLIMVPVRILGWVFRHLLHVIVILAIIGAMGVLIHLGLEELIL